MILVRNIRLPLSAGEPQHRGRHRMSTIFSENIFTFINLFVHIIAFD